MAAAEAISKAPKNNSLCVMDPRGGGGREILGLQEVNGRPEECRETIWSAIAHLIALEVIDR